MRAAPTEALRLGEARRREGPRRPVGPDEPAGGERGERRVDGLGKAGHRPEDGGLVRVVRVRVAEGERVEVFERPGEAAPASSPDRWTAGNAGNAAGLSQGNASDDADEVVV